jgi:hypothetical protein
MKKLLLSLALVLLPALPLLSGGAEAAATFYVSPTGNNSNPGTLALPWATPGFGSKQLQAGDTLIILGGTYVLSQFWDDMITLENSGTASAWIVIKGETGNRPVLAGRNNLLTAVDLAGRSYVRLENLEITHDPTAIGTAIYFRDGIEIMGDTPASHIVLQDLYIHHLDEMALNVQDIDDLQVINCRYEYCGFGGIGGPAGVAGGIRNLLVKGCRLAYMGHYYQGGPGPSPYDRPDGLGLEPSAGPLEIVDTVSEHNRGDGLDSKVANTYIHNCAVANVSCDGIKLWADGSKIENCLVYGMGDGEGGSSPWAGIVIETINPGNPLFTMVNVTVQDNPTREAYPMYVQYYGGPPDPLPPALTLVMRNTIIANGSGTVYVGPTVTLTAQNNLFYRAGDPVQVEANGRVYTAAQIEAGELGPGNLSREPRFVRPAWGTTGDYHLVSGSPGIDQGTATGAPLVDLEYRRRPLGYGFDMGAYEFNPGRSAPPIFLPLLLD